MKSYKFRFYYRDLPSTLHVVKAENLVNAWMLAGEQAAKQKIQVNCVEFLEAS